MKRPRLTMGRWALVGWLAAVGLAAGTAALAGPETGATASAATTTEVVAAGPAAATATAATAAAQDRVTCGARLADDLQALQVPLVAGYAEKRPRLLFGADDRAALVKKSLSEPKLWAEVLASAKRLGPAPDSAEISKGPHYWRIERVESGALAYFVTGERRHLDAAAPWLVAHGREPVWGTDYRPNLDLQASWYLYHIAIAYDMLHGDLAEADRRVIRDGLALHARTIFEGFDPAATRHSYDQNHTYIPATALAAGALALLGEVPEAGEWLRRAQAIMQRSRYVLGQDGYYYEGTGYWSYALHWHVRYAELIGRATGQKFLDLPALRENWRFALHMQLPGAPNMFDIGDIGTWTGRRTSFGPTNSAMFWALASAASDPAAAGAAQLAGNLYYERWPDKDYPAAAFLWFNPAVKPATLAEVKPYHHFRDHDVVAWRSGWGPDATCYLFRCGPSQGHAAAAKLMRMKDWVMNSGHVHPDIGGFWIYGKEAYLSGGTGYTAKKYTRDHNTLLVDGVGQGSDGTYWYERDYPYGKLNEVRIERATLRDDYGYVCGSFGSAYPEAKVGRITLRRHAVMTKRWLLTVDELSGSDAGAKGEHKLTWLCHSEGEFKAEGAGFVARVDKSGLAVLPIGGAATEDQAGPAIVFAGTGPQKGEDQQRGFQLVRTTRAAARVTQLATLLVPLGDGEKVPEVQVDGLGDGAAQATISFTLKWPSGPTERVTVELAEQGEEAEPVRIEMK